MVKQTLASNFRARSTVIFLIVSALCVSSVQATDPVIKYEYDARGRLVKVSNNLDEELYYTLDAVGNRIEVSDTPPQLANPQITNFTGPSSVSSAGSPATLTWVSTDTTHCLLEEDQASYADLASSGTKTIQIYTSTGVTLTCYNGDLSVSKGKFIRLLTSGPIHRR